MLSKTDQSSAMDNFTVLGRIGAGAHGIVMKARHKKSCKLVALKKLLIKRPNEGIPSATQKEKGRIRMKLLLDGTEHQNFYMDLEVIHKVWICGLQAVYSVLGTFNEETWPGAKELPDYSKITFPSMQPIPLEEIVPDASKEAQSLLKAFLVYDGKIRVEADTALRHRFFNSHPIATPLKYMPKSEELFGKTSPDTSQSFENNIQEEFDKLKRLALFISNT
ncbi:CCRK [Lepeophtheirus salmonis]|uniref:Cyclin-dependent kinase 20 n=1 Tax=Lepeophtheirus salmonis TaxID=72036 RepID=A0A7R8HA42_LEPSM|nr:CCRK [Lepeophtheirus salmonis]CAF2950839.1 CCRK [Lepeophtheirus salmonis]